MALKHPFSPEILPDFNCTFARHLVFPDAHPRPYIQQAITALDIDPTWKEYGSTYQNEIASGYITPGTIEFIDETVEYGYFSKQSLQPGDYIGEYTGIIQENNHHLSLKDYLYRYPVPDAIGRDYVIDAEPYGNHTRFINHSFLPNAKPHYAYDGILFHLILIAIKPIVIGEQITYNYGKNYWQLRGKPSPL